MKTPGPDHQEKAAAVARARQRIRSASGDPTPATSLLRTIMEEEIGDERSISILRPSFSGAKSDAPFTSARNENRAPRKAKVPRLVPRVKSQQSAMKISE